MMLEGAFLWLADPANWGGNAGIWARLTQHVVFTMAVVVASAVIAIPLGIAIGHTKRFHALVTLASGAARAIPTLGLLTLLALMLGIGFQAPFIALMVLAFPPLLAGAYAGVESADPVTVDAARAIGMTEWQVVKSVEIPAALPVISAGIRSTVLQVAATATLAAYTSDIGLGRFVFAGMKTNHFEETIGGAILVMALTLFLDAIFKLIRRITETSMRKREGTIAHENQA
ncbi:MAG: ABC transporter permease subunit [Clostridia bacterium]|nr:ABC transporter permease subunit [Clostridia bacterium]